MSSHPGQERLAAAAQHFRSAGALGRSDVLLRLFDFLLTCSLEERAPKEIEIAQRVFGKGSSFDMLEDASVRVYVHRLRRKLEQFEPEAESGGHRLVLPRGEYRLIVAEQDQGSELPAPLVAQPAPARPTWRPDRRSFLGAVAAIGALNLTGWAVWGRYRPPEGFARVADTGFWRPLAESDRPLLMVLGDYYIFGDAPDSMQVQRLVREFEINSRDDLATYLMANPNLVGRYIDLDLHYLPVSAALALQSILPLAAAAAAVRPNPVRLITMSELNVDRLKNSDILYLGFLSGLGVLRDPLFAASSLEIGASYDEIVDRKTGRRYVSDWARIADGGERRRDFGYIASLPGPTGNRVRIIAGTRDAAVMQAAEAAADPSALARINAKTGGAPAFEALFEVRTMGNINLDSALVLARPLHADAAWNAGAPGAERFPDEMPGKAPDPKP